MALLKMVIEVECDEDVSVRRFAMARDSAFAAFRLSGFTPSLRKLTMVADQGEVPVELPEADTLPPPPPSSELPS